MERRTSSRIASLAEQAEEAARLAEEAARAAPPPPAPAKRVKKVNEEAASSPKKTVSTAAAPKKERVGKKPYLYGIQKRRFWTRKETRCLMRDLHYLAHLRGEAGRGFLIWNSILSRHGPQGTVSSLLARRNHVQLKDKARAELQRMQRVNQPVPYWQPMLFPYVFKDLSEEKKSQIKVQQAPTSFETPPVSDAGEDDEEDDDDDSEEEEVPEQAGVNGHGQGNGQVGQLQDAGKANADPSARKETQRKSVQPGPASALGPNSMPDSAMLSIPDAAAALALASASGLAAIPAPPPPPAPGPSFRADQSAELGPGPVPSPSAAARQSAASSSSPHRRSGRLTPGQAQARSEEEQLAAAAQFSALVGALANSSSSNNNNSSGGGGGGGGGDAPDPTALPDPDSSEEGLELDAPPPTRQDQGGVSWWRTANRGWTGIAGTRR